MKKMWHAFLMCQSMFCSIPCPFTVWDEEVRNKMLLFFPVVGLEIGLIWVLLGWVLNYIGLNNLLAGLVLATFPFGITGCIHLDGYMDVTDAVKSCRNLERRREILKDSHVGAFAVIGCIILMLAQYVFCTQISGSYWLLLVIPIISRCCSTISISLLKPMSTSQYHGLDISTVTLFFPLLFLACTMVLGAFWGAGGLRVAFGVLFGYGYALRKGYRSLDGMNGDIAGYALTISELCGLAVMAILEGQV